MSNETRKSTNDLLFPTDRAGSYGQESLEVPGMGSADHLILSFLSPEEVEAKKKVLAINAIIGAFNKDETETKDK